MQFLYNSKSKIDSNLLHQVARNQLLLNSTTFDTSQLQFGKKILYLNLKDLNYRQEITESLTEIMHSKYSCNIKHIILDEQCKKEISLFDGVFKNMNLPYLETIIFKLDSEIYETIIKQILDNKLPCCFQKIKFFESILFNINLKQTEEETYEAHDFESMYHQLTKLESIDKFICKKIRAQVCDYINFENNDSSYYTTINISQWRYFTQQTPQSLIWYGFRFNQIQELQFYESDVEDSLELLMKRDEAFNLVSLRRIRVIPLKSKISYQIYKNDNSKIDRQMQFISRMMKNTYFEVSDFFNNVIIKYTNKDQIIETYTILYNKYPEILSYLDEVRFYLNIRFDVQNLQKFQKCKSLIFSSQKDEKMESNPNDFPNYIKVEDLENMKKLQFSILDKIIKNKIISNLEILELSYPINDINQFIGLMQIGFFAPSFDVFLQFNYQNEEQTSNVIKEYLSIQKYKEFYFNELIFLKEYFPYKILDFRCLRVHEMKSIKKIFQAPNMDESSQRQYLKNKLFIYKTGLESQTPFFEFKKEIILQEKEDLGKNYTSYAYFLGNTLFFNNLNTLMEDEDNKTFSSQQLFRYFDLLHLTQQHLFCVMQKADPKDQVLFTNKIIYNIRDLQNLHLILPYLNSNSQIIFQQPFIQDNIENDNFQNIIKQFITKNSYSQIGCLEQFLTYSSQVLNLQLLKSIPNQMLEQISFLNFKSNQNLIYTDDLQKLSTTNDQNDQNNQLINPEELIKILEKLNNLRSINFEGSSLNDTYYQKITAALAQKPYLNRIFLQKCKIDNLDNHIALFESKRKFYKISNLQNLQDFEYQAFFSLINFTQSTSLRTGFMEQFIKIFLINQKYFDINNLFNQSTNVKELLNSISPLFNMSKDPKVKFKVSPQTFCITSFLLRMDNYIKSFIDDQKIQVISEYYNNIQFLSPSLFSSVTFGFNYLVMDPKKFFSLQNIKLSDNMILYLFSSKFHQNISGTTFKSIQTIMQGQRSENEDKTQFFDFQLLQALETLELGNNSFFNYKGLTNYTKGQVVPWHTANQMIQEKSFFNKKLNSKIIPTKNLSQNADTISQITQSKNIVDDNLSECLSSFIQSSLQSIRIINLSGLNISDHFAEKFSIQLQDPNILKNLTLLDLSNNPRLTSFGLKLFYSNIIDRIPKGFTINLTFVQEDVENLQTRQTILSRRLQNVKEKITKISNQLEKNQDTDTQDQDKLQKQNDELKDFKNKEQSLQKDLQAIKDFLKEHQKISCQQTNTQNDMSGFIFFLQNLANLGLYESIQSYLNHNWSQNRLKIIIMSIILLPFSIFHCFQYLTRNVSQVIETYNIEDYFQWLNLNKKVVSIEIYKSIPDLLDNNDFYFDKDVLNLNNCLCKKIQKYSDVTTLFEFILNLIYQINGREKGDMNRIKQYIENPTQACFENLTVYDHKNNDTRILLSYTTNILFINFICYTIFLAGFYPFIPYFSSDSKCKAGILNDIPLFAYYIISSIIEYLLVKNIAFIIGSDRIYNATSLQTIVQMYNSVTARYDVYTDIVFSLKLLFCESSDFDDLAYLTLIIIIVNFIFTTANTIQIYNKINWLKNNSQGNTDFINEFTKLAFVSEYYAIAMVFDRFSTSSATELPIKSLKGIKIPQVILSKFQRVFLENLPQVFILGTYHYRKIMEQGNTDAFYDWDNLVVLITTLMSLQSALAYAWHAKPSSFRSYQFKMFQSFQQIVTRQYEIIITYNKEEKRFRKEQLLDMISYFHNHLKDQKPNKDNEIQQNLKIQANNNNDVVSLKDLNDNDDDNKSHKSLLQKSQNQSHLSFESNNSRVSKTNLSGNKQVDELSQVEIQGIQLKLIHLLFGIRRQNREPQKPLEPLNPLKSQDILENLEEKQKEKSIVIDN